MYVVFDMKHVALSVAGSDSSGGAGVQADVKSFQFTGVHGCCVLSCVTAQNSQGVSQIFRMPVDMISDQVEAVFSEYPIHVAKTGMLFDAEIAGIVADCFEDHHLRPVVDPVMVATSGDILAASSFVSLLKKRLLPQSFMVTANIPEAETLTKTSITSVEEMKKACRLLYPFGSKYVLIKGGHLPTDSVVDMLYDGKKYWEWSLPRFPNTKAHGSGCSLSALITGYLARKCKPAEAVEKAKYAVWSMIAEGYRFGKGPDVLNHNPSFVLPNSLSDASQVNIWQQLKKAVLHLEAFLPASHVAEVGINFAYAQEKAETFAEVCAVDGRITRKGNRVQRCGDLKFDCSRHVARVVLAAMAYDPHMRSALNIRYAKKTIARCKKKKLRVSSFDRNDEPTTVSSTMEWGATQAIQSLGCMPDVIYDEGAVGKEPMIRILGKNPDDVLSKLKKLVK